MSISPSQPGATTSPALGRKGGRPHGRVGLGVPICQPSSSVLRGESREKIAGVGSTGAQNLIRDEGFHHTREECLICLVGGLLVVPPDQCHTTTSSCSGMRAMLVGLFHMRKNSTRVSLPKSGKTSFNHNPADHPSPSES
jgi:hypothetical protein